jgi:hypothetical protein
VVAKKRTSKRLRGPGRLAVILLSAGASVVVFRAILGGPPPAHAAPTLVPAAVPQAPTLEQMIAQAEQQGDDGFGGGAMPSGGARFRTRGS